MKLIYAWLVCLVNMGVCFYYFMNHWKSQKELYWAVIALLNTKAAVVLIISQLITLYSAIVMSFHSFVFTRTKEGERFVDPCN